MSSPLFTETVSNSLSSSLIMGDSFVSGDGNFVKATQQDYDFPETVDSSMDYHIFIKIKIFNVFIVSKIIYVLFLAFYSTCIFKKDILIYSCMSSRRGKM